MNNLMLDTAFCIKTNWSPLVEKLFAISRSRAAQGTPLQAGQVNGCPFWFIFGQTKMNK